MPYTKKQEVAIQGYYFTILELITKHTAQVKAAGERCSRNGRLASHVLYT